MDGCSLSKKASKTISFFVLLIYPITALLTCECNTNECLRDNQSSCVARRQCYTERFINSFTKGCDPTTLSCDNRKPAGLRMHWPELVCCGDVDFCNKHWKPSSRSKDRDVTYERSTQLPTLPQINEMIEEKPCTNRPTLDSNKNKQKIINPIYIAVPVAGVCVLLALIIFAIYILRRRTYYHHEAFHNYQHDHSRSSVDKQVLPHHCQCVCKTQMISPCSNKVNRCTDSERSSSGSETKLFLQT